MIKLRKYQEEAIYSVFQFFYSKKKGNPLVVAPTGSGKTYMISEFCNRVLNRWPSQKILIISHVKEILEQDYKALKNLDKRIGLYSAGLKKKVLKNITVAGIHSIYNKPELFDQFNIVIVDEAHMIPHSKDGMYRKFFLQVKKPVIGFTATPYRLGKGYLHLGEDAFFDEIVYTVNIKKLQKDGHLCKLSTKGTKEKLNPAGIKKQAGDYVIRELSLKFDREAVTNNIINELLMYKNVRKKWLIFAIDISHSENITSQLQKEGISTRCVHSKMKANREETIRKFKEGKFQVLVSVTVLTTGFDAPDVDLIALLRPTASPVLHVQTIGRGLRTAPNKNDCLILDFAGNLIRNGPIDAPIIKLKGQGTGEAIMKECDRCYEIVHAAVKICPACKKEFLFRHKLKTTPDDTKILSSENWHKVTDIKYFNYEGKRKIRMLKVSYFCGLRRFNEYVCLEHGGYAQRKAQYWWSRRSDLLPPDTAQQALEQSDSLKEPIEIFVREGESYPEILNHRF